MMKRKVQLIKVKDLLYGIFILFSLLLANEWWGIGGGVVNAAEIDTFPLLDELPSDADEQDYIILNGNEISDYQVKKGDNLWSIAKVYYGKGTEWGKIQEANSDIIEDGDLIFPDMELHLPPLGTKYIKREHKTNMGLNSLSYSFDAPNSWTYASNTWEPCLDPFVSYDGSTRVYVNVTETRFTKNEFSDDWEAFIKQIEESCKETDLNNNISSLSFEKYTSETGLDLSLFSFYLKDPKIHYTVCYLTGDKFQAEFIGVMPDSASKEGESALIISDIVRYMAASYIEKGGERTFRHLKYKQYTGAETWPWESLHNPFALAIENYQVPDVPELTIEDYEISFTSSNFEFFVRSCCRLYFDMNWKEFEEFEQRPLYASDLTWITDVTIEESAIPGRDIILINVYNPVNATVVELELDSLEDIRGFINLNRINLGIGNISDYSALSEFTNLTDISIMASNEYISLEWIKDMPQLKSFTFKVSNLARSIENGFIKEEGSTYNDYVIDTQNTWDASVFTTCTELEYLELEKEGLVDVSFLNELPNLYSLNLTNINDKDESPDLFDEDSYPQIKCLLYNSKWLRNPA